MEINRKSNANPLNPSDIDFPFLEKTIEILVLHDEPAILELYSEYLSLYKPYNVITASCSKEARAILLSNNRIRVCIMDLGLMDLNNDEYYFIKEFSSKTSFILVTGRDSLEAGFKAHSLGVCAVIKKPGNFETISIINEINNAFLQNIFMKSAKENCKPVILCTMFLKAFEYYTGLYCKELRLKNNLEGVLLNDFE